MVNGIRAPRISWQCHYLSLQVTRRRYSESTHTWGDFNDFDDDDYNGGYYDDYSSGYSYLE